MLVDHADTARDGIRGISDLHRFPVEQALVIVIWGQANGGRRGGRVVAHCSGNKVATCGTLSNCLNSILELLLGACDDTLRQVRERQRLVDIDTNAVNTSITG